MIDVLAANAEKSEQQGRPTAESIRAARDGGAFRLGTPPIDATEVAETLTRMGRACPSTAWIAGTSLNGKVLAATVAGFDTLADPDAIFCGTGNPTGRGERGPGGVRITGRWASVSGCEDAEWATLGLLVDGTFSLAVIPASGLTIDRTWDMAGMRGTGSHTVVADGLLVDDGLVAPFTGPPSRANALLFAITVLAPVVGATFGALDVITAMFASDRKPYMTSYARMSESPEARHWLAEATSLAQRADRTMLAVAKALVGGAGVAELDAARFQLDLSRAARDCRAAVDRMLDLHGASGFRMTNPLQRLWRDVAVGSRHPFLTEYLAVEGYGRALAR